MSSLKSLPIFRFFPSATALGIVFFLSACSHGGTTEVFSGALVGMDAKFGNGGYTAFSFQSDARAMAARRDPSTGNVLFATLGSAQLILTHLLPDGMPDTRFGASGNLPVALDTSQNRAFSLLAIDPASGDVVVYGDAGAGNDGAALLMRFQANGSPVSGFGQNGRVSPGFQARALTISATGTIGMVGTHGGTSTANGTGVAAELFSNGGFNPSFGNGKVETVSLPTDYQNIQVTPDALAFEPDSSLLISAFAFGGGPTAGPMLLHYLANGGLDTTFGQGGVAALDGIAVSDTIDQIQDAGSSSGGIFIHADAPNSSAAATGSSSSPPFVLEQFDTSGYYQSQESLAAAGNCAAKFAITSDGHAFGSASYSGASGRGVCVSRFTAQGVPDTAFGTKGLVEEAFEGDLSGAVLGITPESDGGALVFGYTQGTSSSSPVASNLTTIVAFVMRIAP